MNAALTTLPYRYLIVDDDVFSAKCLATALTRFGAADILNAENGAIAVGLLEDAALLPDIIICDLNMPELDGVEYLMHLAKSQFSGGIILISGTSPKLLSSVMRLATAHRLNVLGTLVKPVSMDDLIQMLTRFGDEKNAAVSG